MDTNDFNLLMKSLSEEQNASDEDKVISDNLLSDISENLECKVCSKQLSNKSNLERHVKTVHAFKKTVDCDLCDFQANEERILKSHVVSIHNENKTKCHICEKVVGHNYLNKHIKFIHKTFKQSCPECQKEFENEFYLKDHFKRIHKERKSFCCDICNFQTKSEESLNSHKIIKHDVFDVKDLNKKKYFCKVCNFAVSKKLYLEIHNSRNHGIKKSCDECGFFWQIPVNFWINIRSYIQIDPLLIVHYVHTRLNAKEI